MKLQPPNVVAASSLTSGWLGIAKRIDSPNFDARPEGTRVCLVVLHHISLPAGRFDGDGVERLFTNRIDQSDADLAEIASLRVSAHFFLRRTGELIQWVNIHDRAWHAGVSIWHGRERCNDFSIGIEIEGDAEHPFESAQYNTLNHLLSELNTAFPKFSLTTHAEIAFGRKIDPGAKFDFALIKTSFIKKC